ncbi:MAG: FKBP-type peptidyl-prolyl cis-trans isomerase [Prevotella sp.]|jgi:FKBP-type peptidyl-prolyl cis-trans isomerase FklB|nr:FKBP-type peptidyl-prolyl cis-trans isomerase [Prevotella sp.]
MKKLLFLALASCAFLSPLALSAQKKTQPGKVTPEPLTLKTGADTISYAFGAMMGKSGIQIQMGVVADTAAVKSDYKTKIEKEKDSLEKDKLGKELAFKLDSLNKSNLKNTDDFLAGFNQAMNQSKDKNAFNMGVALGSQFAPMSENITKELFRGNDKFDKQTFVAAFTSSLKEEKLLIENPEEIVQAASEKAREAAELKKNEGLKEEYAEKIAAGEAFLAENKTKDGVVTLPNGLQYKIEKEGTGPVPTEEDRVKVDYVGTLLDGEQFDSSIERGEPAVFGVTQVIKGWTEALLLMPVGSKWIIYVPYDLAYGSRDTGSIKPYSTLVFEIELLGIEE